ncbi:MAG: hypothetical protein GY788_32525, partial [bacterium]|nr:hypothetical protein [bacterium]
MGCPLRIVGETTVNDRPDGQYVRATAESVTADGTLQPSWTLVILVAPGDKGAPAVWALAFGYVGGRRISCAAGDHLGIERTETGWNVRGWESDEYGEW